MSGVPLPRAEGNRRNRSPEWFVPRFAPQGSYRFIRDNASDLLHHEGALHVLSAAPDGFRPSRVVDVGCALGDFTARLAARFPGAAVAGMDFMRVGLEDGQRRFPGIGWVEAALPTLPFRTASVDLVACLEVLYYLTDVARAYAIEEFARVLTPGGLLLVAVNLDSGKRYFTREGFEALLAPRFEMLSWMPEYCSPYRTFNAIARRGAGLLRGGRARKVPGAPLLAGVLESFMRSKPIARTTCDLSRAVLGERARTNGIYLYRLREPAAA